MACNHQPDLFGNDMQPEFDADAAPKVYLADPEKVRIRLHNILAEVRSAQTLPWDARQLKLYQTIFPQMTNWLPEPEAAQLRFEFEAELVRLKAA